MNEFVILSDSCHDLPKELIAQLNVGVAPLSVEYDEKTVFDDGEMAPKAFYDGIRNGKMPKTSAVNLEGWKKLMKPALAEGKDVLALCFAYGLSTTYQSAVIAADELREKYPDRKILVIDTHSASVGHGLIVWNAAKLRAEGKTIEEVYAWVEENMLHVCHWVTVNDLMHLKRGGRLNAATAVVGSMLKIKPIIHVDNEGKLINVAKARGRKASIDALAKKVGELGSGYDNSTCFISHGDCIEDAQYLEKLLKEKYGVKEVVIGYVGAVIGSHAGPGVLALFFLGEHK